MNKVTFMNSLTRNFHRANLQLKKHSPEILVVAGIAGVITSAVLACKATMKVNDVLEEAKTEVEAVHAEEHTEEENKKALAAVYVKTGIKFINLYGPAITLGAASITSILASNNIMRKRNVALSAAYVAVDTGFKEYRSRVVERFGQELDRELRYNVKAKEVEEVTVDEDGKETVVKKTVCVADDCSKMYSSYARCYDDGCKGWTKDSELNLLFLRQTQNYANDLLRSKGHLFLNEVYDMLGIYRSKAGQVVGWVYDEKNPVGDNYVDFGIYDIYKEGCRDFVNGIERTIWLDFNVDGNILDLI